MYTYMCIYTHMYVCIYTHIYLSIYVYIYIHRYVDTVFNGRVAHAYWKSQARADDASAGVHEFPHIFSVGSYTTYAYCCLEPLPCI